MNQAEKEAYLRDYAILKNQEQKATTFVARAYSRVIESQRVLEIRQLQREAQAEQLRVRSLAFAEGNKQSPIEFLLTAQQQFTLALIQEYQAIVDYNIALASFEFGRGTIMQHCKVSIAEAPLPGATTFLPIRFEMTPGYVFTPARSRVQQGCPHVLDHSFAVLAGPGRSIRRTRIAGPRLSPFRLAGRACRSGPLGQAT